jgi:hypothetical protein
MRFTPEEDFVLPIHVVSCPHCRVWVPTEGLELLEALWMHEYECSALVLEDEGQPSALVVEEELSAAA